MCSTQVMGPQCSTTSEKAHSKRIFGIEQRGFGSAVEFQDGRNRSFVDMDKTKFDCSTFARCRRRLSAKPKVALARLSPTLKPEQYLQQRFSFYRYITAMLSRALRGHHALPLGRNVNIYVPLAKRTVTTDAASSHAEKEHVPEVGRVP